MDNLYIENEVPLGDTVVLIGQVNNAFNTSMEVGVQVTSESRITGRVQVVCSAFFMFVALDSNGKKQRVQPVVAESVEEQHV